MDENQVGGEASGIDELTTEWFSIEDDFEVADVPGLPRRHHHVTAVLVSHEGATWLPAALTNLAAQTRPPEAVVGVDTGSTDGSLSQLRAAFGSDRVVAADSKLGFGDAVRAGVAHVGQVRVAPSDEPVEELVEWSGNNITSVVSNQTTTRQCYIIPQVTVLNVRCVVPYRQRQTTVCLFEQQTSLSVVI